MTQGYWNNPEETKLAFRNGMFRTGDIGFRDGDGYFFILDRLKDMIVTGGENVYSGERRGHNLPTSCRHRGRGLWNPRPAMVEKSSWLAWS